MVTGIPRSGTRICARIIANDTGHQYIDETELRNTTDYKLTNVAKLKFYIKYFPNLVIQSPQLAYCCHEIDDLFVVWLKRDVEEIKASMSRIKMEEHTILNELANYGEEFGDRDLLIETKLKIWETQKSVLKDNFLEVEYNDLKPHPLFLGHRNNFVWCQTK